MNTKQIIIAISFLSAVGSAFAQQPAAADAGLSRDQVRTELKQAQDNGTSVNYGFVGSAPVTTSADQTSAQGKTRAQVVAELKQAQDDGSTAFCGFLGFRCATSMIPDASKK